ncbi:hypothetical protein [Chelativorans intermedius]|uniref:Response regulatory domain-containing protein n=1 Tax=Chelativorans intermedius TaxID=515947 RepID=A0ABV6DBS6_9HYPH|nr:hypothetical protein [Chelativorans intermedius]MCT8998760.1 hypothetical protein [Chelativorans intermedius]
MTNTGKYTHDGTENPGHTPSESPNARESRLVLVVSASPVNRIVISSTLQRIYLKPRAVGPDAALTALRECRPLMAIVDGALADVRLAPFLSELATRRRSSGEGLPRTVLIADPSQKDRPARPEIIDVVAAKPITPDALQPIVERLLADDG